MKVYGPYGPYKNSPNRIYFIYVDDNGNRTFESCFKDDAEKIEKLRELTIPDEIKYRRIIQYYHFTCPICGTESKIPMAQYRSRQIVRKCSGPYCGKSCAGKAFHKLKGRGNGKDSAVG